RATAPTVLPSSKTRRTAWTLKSSSKCRRGAQAFRCVGHSGHRSRLSEDVHEIGSSAAQNEYSMRPSYNLAQEAKTRRTAAGTLGRVPHPKVGAKTGASAVQPADVAFATGVPGGILMVPTTETWSVLLRRLLEAPVVLEFSMQLRGPQLSTPGRPVRHDYPLT